MTMITKRLAVIGVLVIAVVGAAIVFRPAPDEPVDDSTARVEIVYTETEHDFGIVLQSGGLVSYAFPYTYEGSIERTVIGVPTSCGCTTAEIDRETLRPGDSGVVTVTFDPNLHEEPEGRFFKTASLLTEPSLTKQDDLRIWVEIDLDLGPDAYKLATHDDDHDDDHTDGKPYHTVSASELRSWMSGKEFTEGFFLLDTHIPEQEHIPSTDAFIPFNEVAIRADELPADKDTKIVVYCRSGSMSAQAAEALTEMGYTNVYDLEGGIRAYNDQ